MCRDKLNRGLTVYQIYAIASVMESGFIWRGLVMKERKRAS